MVKKRFQKQAPKERQKKRQRSASAITPLETASQPMQQSSISDRGADDQRTAPPGPRVFETKEWTNQSFFLESIAAKSPPMLLTLGVSRRASIADGNSNALDGQVSSDCSSSSSSSVHDNSEESSLSLPILTVPANECHVHDLIRRRIVENEERSVKSAFEKNKYVRLSPTTIAVIGLMVACLCTSFSIDLTAPISAVIDKCRAKVERDSVCVSGGGFSGFWFILGRLQSIPDPANKNYYCFSAGCLGLVASLKGIAMVEVHSAAMNAQTRWKTGEIARHEMLTSFVDYLVNHNVANETIDTGIVGEQDLAFLNRLNVLTTVRDGRVGLKTSTRTPTSVDSLRTLLIQTAWIPFVVGNELFHEDHMDGAFYLFGHPRCEHSIGLPGNLDILANILNVNLSADKVQKFWKMGIVRGL